MEPGTGKTRVSIELVNKSPCDAVFWIGPLRTLQNTSTEINKWGGFKINCYYYGIESLQSSDRIYLNLLADIQKANVPFVIVDESLKIKNVDAKRTKRVLDIGKIVKYKLILNGTPLSKSLLDLWSQMEFLSPLILNMTFNEFKTVFCEYTRITKRMGYKQYTKEFITGYENIDYLYSLIRHYVFECDLSLNVSQNYHDVPFQLGEDERANYNDIKKAFLSSEMLEWRNNNIFLEMTQKMQHSYCCADSKIEAVKAILAKEADPERTIIFCKYVDSYQLCKNEFSKAKVLSYQKEALGLNLQQYCNTIYFDKTWDYSLRVQSGRRTYRYGQEYDCRYWDLTGDVGLEKMIDKNIANKISMSEYFKGKTKDDLNKEL